MVWATYPLAALLLTVGPSTEGQSGAEAYYLVVFAAQQEGFHPETSHCFATIARVFREAGGRSGAGREPSVELHHINWFSPRGHECGVTQGLLVRDGRSAPPEPGENRTTRDALAMAMRRELRITRWGPYRIDRALYDRALRQIDLLEGRVPGRQVGYKALDIGFRESSEVRAMNCIHAISDIDRDAGILRTWTSYGDEAARHVVRHLDRWFIKGPEQGKVRAGHARSRRGVAGDLAPDLGSRPDADALDRPGRSDRRGDHGEEPVIPGAAR